MKIEDAFDDYQQAVFDFVYRLTHRADLAEDITQECFLALVRQPERFNPDRGTLTKDVFICDRAEPGAQELSRPESYRVSRTERGGLHDGPAIVFGNIVRCGERRPEALVLFH